MVLSNTQILPTHVGIILDGNRRWAKENGLATLKGHRQGMDVLKDISFHAFDRGIKYLSAYVFSTENWQRAEEEVNYLMDLTIRAVEKYLDEYNERGIKVVILGRREGIRQNVLDAIARAEENTKDNSHGTLAICFNYGGKEEIVDAVKQIVAHKYSKEDITSEIISENLYAHEIPDMDLMIRTSGELRTSGFMLFRAAYAELAFVNTFWPEFTTTDFDNAINDFSQRERRYGN